MKDLNEHDLVEWVDVVDENNVVTVRASKEQVLDRDLCHRVIHIVVHDGEGKILAQKRSETSERYPNSLDATANGVVLSGESWLEAAKRVAEKKLGIADVPFADHGVFYFSQEVYQVWVGLFSCVSHGPFALQQDTYEVNWLTIEEITAIKNEFTADSLEALSLWINRNSESLYLKKQTS